MKKFDFDKALKELNEEELDEAQTRNAKILVTVLPFVIIILILAGMLLTSALKNDKKNGTENSSQTLPESSVTQTETTPDDSDDASDVAAKPTATPESTKEPTEEPSMAPESTPENSEENNGENSTEITEEDIVSEVTPKYVNEPFQAENQLAELFDYFVSDNRKAIEDLVHLDRYKAMSYSLKGTDDFYYFGDRNAEGKPHGKGISVYADNMYYYGEWSDGLRNGGGFFIHYHMPECYTNKNVVIYHQFTGNWKNDLPEGEGSEHYEYYVDRFQKNTGYNTNLLGSYHNGLIHGDFFITNLYSDENVKEWDATAQNGSWVYCSDTKDQVGRGPVYVDRKDEDNYIWMHPDKNQKIGVSCLISSQKN